MSSTTQAMADASASMANAIAFLQAGHGDHAFAALQTAMSHTGTVVAQMDAQMAQTAAALNATPLPFPSMPPLPPLPEPPSPSSFLTLSPLPPPPPSTTASTPPLPTAQMAPPPPKKKHESAAQAAQAILKSTNALAKSCSLCKKPITNLSAAKPCFSGSKSQPCSAVYCNVNCEASDWHNHNTTVHGWTPPTTKPDECCIA